MIEFWVILFGAITVWVLIGKVGDYYKYKTRAETDRKVVDALDDLRQEVAGLKEMMADVLLELDDYRRMLDQKQGALPSSSPKVDSHSGDRESVEHVRRK
ncbi:MAG: hypothetical protein KatS3mg115_0799 [Candidatus Poribacteria bacterium]|nr:MAG: hypothetical protein KatS3mg115_0799 [Candidatus Poribacteria bacterium]